MSHDAPSFLPLLEIGDTGIVLPEKYRAKRTPQPRGHRAKIFAAVTALRAAGQLPPWLNLVEVRHRCEGWLKVQGLRAHELPCLSAYKRHLARALSASEPN